MVPTLLLDYKGRVMLYLANADLGNAGSGRSTVFH